MTFDLFVGIDWSGAKGARHKGIALFACKKGAGVPVKLSPPDGKPYFSRADVAKTLVSLSSAQRVLAGIDFAFAYPIDDKGHYFPDLPADKQPSSALDLWAMVEAVNAPAPDFYGGLIWDHPDYGPYYNAPSGRKGARFASRRRLTEQVASAVKSPSPTFNCVGPAGVGTGSLAGMRLCHHLHSQAVIWPFMQDKSANLHLVEIFPSYYFKKAGITPVNGAQAEIGNLNKALAFYQSASVADDFVAAGPDNDDADALISAAALRFFAAQSAFWQVPAQASREGWIFGLESDKTAP